MKTKNDKKLVVEELLKITGKGVPGDVKKALEKLSRNGNLTIIPKLLNILILETNADIKKMISEFIANVQDPGIVDINMEFIKSNEKPETIISITPCIWNSKHDYSRYISDFVSLAVEGDYMMALESLTIMEQMNGPFDESWLLESQLFLKEYVEKPQRKDERKDKILSDIAYFIKSQNNGIDADLLLE